MISRCCRWYAAAPDPLDSEPEQEREVGNPRVHRLVDEICSMNLLEIADLTELLRKKLGISASPGMYMGKACTLHLCMVYSVPSPCSQ